ncbi:MAG: fluoride efflux transporter CrcB [Chloroflexi bacterium]|nr:fluoride efflux transporter CrcB [Chloroflexota bacterium]
MVWVLVAAGGAAGSVLRFAAGRLAIQLFGTGTVWGTLFVNVTGSFALGFFLAYALQRGEISGDIRAMVAIGLLGGYTTFSTLSYDTIRLLESGELGRAGINILANLVIGLTAAYLGVLSGRAV